MASVVAKGRPYRGERISVRIPPDVLARLDAYAAEHGISRADAIRQLLEEATP